jgi:protein-tyrosine phosphatase
MDWITDTIAVGNYLDALNVELLRREGINSALSLDATLYGKVPGDCGLQRIEVAPLEDAPCNEVRLFRRAVECLIELVRDAPPVLVQCHAGRSRSAVVVAGYLVMERGLLSEEALALVASKRDIAVTAGVERLLDCL